MTRRSRPGDEDGLKRIWKLSFDDEDSFVESFFRHVYEPGTAVVLERGGKLVSAMYIIWGVKLVLPGRVIRCPYLYALGTLPEHRGMGYGEEVTRQAAITAAADGGEVGVLPADDGLYRWYERRLGAKAAFYVRERTFTFPPSPRPQPELRAPMAPVTPGEYAVLREELLDGTPHIRFDDKLIRWQRELCRESGGGLLRLGDEAAAAVERSGGTIYVKELLHRDASVSDLASALAGYFGVASVHVRTPVFMGDGDMETRDFTALIQPQIDSPARVSLNRVGGSASALELRARFVSGDTPPNATLTTPENAYWGFAFD